MSEGPPQLKRAATEFLVIVGGILAAFYVEEFREARGDRALEREYAQQIASDLDDALETVSGGVQLATRRAYAGRVVLTHLSGGPQQTPSHLIIAAYEVALYPIARERRLGRRTTYDEMVTTGNLRTIVDTGLRHSLARYYEEYARIGGRLEDSPEEWRVWVYRLLSPDVILSLSQVVRNDVEGCFSEAEMQDYCSLAIPSEDELRFVRQLQSEAEYARGELHRVVRYQDRQMSDLAGFLEVTTALREELSASGLLR